MTETKTAKTTKRVTRVTQAAVAKDVLKLLSEGILTVEHLIYCHFPGDFASAKPQSFQSVLKRINPGGGRRNSCRVCAIGAIFAADVFKRNRFNVTPYMASVSDGAIREHMKEIFAPQDLALIESAFEGFSVDEASPLFSLSEYARKFYNSVDDDTARMIRIMKNIIKHGCFRPDLEKWA